MSLLVKLFATVSTLISPNGLMDASSLVLHLVSPELLGKPTFVAFHLKYNDLQRYQYAKKDNLPNNGIHGWTQTCMGMVSVSGFQLLTSAMIRGIIN